MWPYLRARGQITLPAETKGGFVAEPPKTTVMEEMCKGVWENAAGELGGNPGEYDIKEIRVRRVFRKGRIGHQSWVVELITYNPDLLFAAQSLNPVWIFVTPWTAACQAPLSFTISQELLKLISTETVMPSNHIILSSRSPPALSLSQHQRLFQWVGSLHQVSKVLEFQLKHQAF